MDKIKQVKVIGNVIGFNMYGSKKETYNVQFPDMTIAELESYQFEEADAYHTNDRPRYLRNVLARLRELPEHDRNIWLKGIMGEFKKDFSVEQEKRYKVKLKNTDDYLVKTNNDDYHFYNNIYIQNRKHTRKELEDAGFGWVFDCEGVEVQEVE